jgi:hypothetical protein
MTNIPFILLLGRFILSRPFMSFSVFQSKFHRCQISSSCKCSFTSLWKAGARSVYKSRHLTALSTALAYFGFHPPRLLIHPPSRTGDASQRDFLLVPGTIYRCTNPQTPTLHKLQCGNIFNFLSPHNPLKYDCKLGLRHLFSSLCISCTSIRRGMRADTC